MGGGTVQEAGWALRTVWMGAENLTPHMLQLKRSGNEKESFYEDLEHVFKQYLMHQVKLILGDFNTK